ncbi:MAG: carboxylesterase [Gammaproteobacteria bacterium]|nr:MAG: carboxylesterase [Gammaproteobacteria bacterium]
MSTLLPCEIVEPSSPATASVIWLHGIGDDGQGFVPIVPHLKLPASLAVRFVFPNAPIRPVTCNSGMAMRSWYDILELSEIRKINEQHLRDASNLIIDLIKAENEKGIPCERIVLVGYSQGGAVAYHTALHYPEKLAGLIALSTYMGITKDIANTVSASNRSIPVKVAYGKQDEVIAERAARLAYDTLKDLNYNISWKSYQMGHEICVSEIRDIGKWISGMLC